MIVSIKRIGIFSVFKVGCLVSAFFWILFAILCAFVLLVGALGVVKLATYREFVAALIAGGPAVVIYALLSGIVPGLVLAFHAWMYNVVARFFGGVVVKLDRRALKEVDLAPGANRARPTPPTPGPERPPLDEAMPAQSSGIGQAARDEIAAINKQIKERQRRIQELNTTMFRKS